MVQKIIDTAGYNAVVKGKYGHIVYNKNDIYIGRAVEKYGEFSEAEVELFRQLCQPGDVVVEVGANIGTHTMVLAAMVGNQGRVYAFEPQRIVYYTLCANMALNSIENAYCFQMAAGLEEGTILLPGIRYDQEGNFGGVEVNKFDYGDKVRVVKLDDFLEPPKLKLLKIDVEGMEHDVISGAKALISRYKPALYVENDRLDKSKALIELIQSLDYRLYWHMPPLFNPNNFARDNENLYPGIVSVNMLCFHKSFDIKVDGFQEVLNSDFHPMKR
ncbi:MAG: FkbM family methyltransferase [Gammaproteobacteria bacterium]|nr:FkbM family methyltransferase [Gammaproteobacteria bacterium]